MWKTFVTVDANTDTIVTHILVYPILMTERG